MARFEAVFPAGTWNRSILVLVAISASFLALERMIGDTILGNVILLVLAIGIAFVAAIIALVDLVERRTVKSIAGLLASLAPITYVVVRFALDSVPAGYGP